MCWYCGSPIADSEPLGRSLRCPQCGKDLRACRHCRRFLPPGGCSESGAEVPAEKDRANFCGWFSLDPRFREASAGDAKQARAAAAAKLAFGNLFT
jgi:predicted RNA-binding Zn-ribbon protein involved in translation (DUF1610 family)